MSDGEYLLDNRAQEAGLRFDALSAIFNPVTFRHAESLGIAPGWRCWEVGAGGPTVAAWLAEQVGPEGHVVATDLDVSWIGEDAAFEARRHDVAQEDPPGDGFDFVHARLVLVHVPARDEALRRMVGSLRPGDWLLLEDFAMGRQPLSSLEESTAEAELANKVRRGFRQLLEQRGADNDYGSKLPRLLREAGLRDVAADAYFPVALDATRALERANVNQVRAGLVEQGLASEEEIERHLEALERDAVDVATPPLVSAWGLRDG